MKSNYILRLPYDEYDCYTDSWRNYTGHKVFETKEDAKKYIKYNIEGSTDNIDIYEKSKWCT